MSTSSSYAEAMTQLRDFDELERKYEHCLRLIDAYEREKQPKKVYVVTYGWYSGYSIKRIFADKKAAITYCAVHNKLHPYMGSSDIYRVESYTLDDDAIKGRTPYVYAYKGYTQLVPDVSEPIIVKKSEADKAIHKYSHVWVVLDKRNDKLAKKMWCDRCAQKKA